MPFNSIPAWMLIHAVLFEMKQLNIFPVKGGLLSMLSPKQIMSGEVVHYKLCAMDFGRYHQIHEKNQPQNNLAARTQGVMSLGSSGNAQGGHTSEGQNFDLAKYIVSSTRYEYSIQYI
jgi:hypothetical protein